MTQEEFDRIVEASKFNGCGTQMAMYILIAVFLLCSCTTKSLVETDTQYQHISELTERMDSLIHSTSTWQQSLFEKQTALVDSFMQKEVRDTSRVVFLNEKKDTIKEVITIKETVEREHNTSESTQEFQQEIFKQTDSLFASNKILQEKVDSLLHDHNKETLVEKEAPWYQRIWMNIAPWVIIALLSYIIIFYKKK
jgi:hypothetical protein